MLDHAPRRVGDSRQPTSEIRTDPLPPTPSMLATRLGNPRLSTGPRRTADAAPLPQHGAPAAASPDIAGDPVGSPRQSFGARIAEAMARARARPASAPVESVDPVRATEPAPAAELPREVSAAPAASTPAVWFSGAEVDPERPLLDPSILVASLVRRWKLIAATTVLGAVGGVLLALATPHRYYAENRLFVDPRELRLTEDDLRNQTLSTEAMIALTDSQVQILTSTLVLVKVVDELGLARDPEFNGTMTSGGIASGIALIRDLIRGKDSASESDQEAIIKLRDSVSVSRDPRTFVLNVGAVTRDPAKSALIANTLVDTYLEEEGAAQSGLMESASEAIDTRLEALQSDLNAAERAVEEFRARNDLVGINGELLDDRQTLALTNQLAAARAQKVAVKVKADSLAKARFEDVLVGAFPEEFLSGTLIELRKQYSQAKSNADSLGTRLGPRHPQFIAAGSVLESTRNEIRAELRRIVASSQAELQRAVETEQELASQLAVSKKQSLDNSVELVTLRELERKAAATRNVYEGFLKRSREASERGNLSTRTARVISPAEAPIHPLGPSRKIVAIGGMVGGAGLGIAIALLIGAVESFRRNGLGGPGTAGRRAVAPSPDPGAGPAGGRPRTAPADAHALAGRGREDASLAAGEAMIRAEAALAAAEEAHARRMAEMTETHARALQAALDQTQSGERATRPEQAPPFPAAPQPAVMPPAFVAAPLQVQPPAFLAPPPLYAQPPLQAGHPFAPFAASMPAGHVMTAYGPVPVAPSPLLPFVPQPWPQPPIAAPGFVAHPVQPQPPVTPPPAAMPAQTVAAEPVREPSAGPARRDAAEIARIRDDMRRLRERIDGGVARRA